jgi:polyvinyl alcohol dehydrogenase (cytochrome)
LRILSLCRRFVWGAIPLLAACAGGSHTPVPYAAPVAAPAASPTAFPTEAGAVDDWTMFAHDSARTGFEAQNTGITPATVGGLTLRWSYAYGEPVLSSPLVAGGLVYLAGSSGPVRALAATDGSVVWQTNVGAEVRMTPTLDAGLLFVGTHVAPGTFDALDAATGAVRWSATLPGAIRGEPLVLGGVVYVGDASGDPPACNQGGVHGFNELTGTPVLTWYDDPTPSDGGAVWSPISTDGDALYLGTGNTCTPGITYANAAVKLSTAGTVAWGHNSANALSDDDFGGALAIVGDEAIGIDKNGILYAFDRASGTIAWSDRLGDLDGYGGLSSPGTDGRTIVIGGGYINDPTKTPDNPGGLLYGVSRSGSVAWKITLQTAMLGSAAVVPGLAFVSMNDGLYALSIGTGATLWSYSYGDDYAYGSPAIVPSGVYAAAASGRVYAFGLPAASVARRAANTRSR